MMSGPFKMQGRERARSLVVRNLRLETKDSQFKSGCFLGAEVHSLQ